MMDSPQHQAENERMRHQQKGRADTDENIPNEQTPPSGVQLGKVVCVVASVPAGVVVVAIEKVGVAQVPLWSGIGGSVAVGISVCASGSSVYASGSISVCANCNINALVGAVRCSVFSDIVFPISVVEI